MPAETIAVRSGEELDPLLLAAYLSGKIEGAEQGVAIEQFPGGHSNLTYLLRIGNCEYVLRRGPLGPVAPKAHDMGREYKVLQVLHPHFPEAPKAYLLCQDTSVLGAEFYLMERRRGAIVRDHVPSDLAAIRDSRERLSASLVDCLVRLHAIDIAAAGLRDLGKPEGFLERQVHGWAERWRHARSSDSDKENEGADRVIQWLIDRLPPSPSPTIVHNDYKLDNIMFRLMPGDEAPSVVAVLDWEMATVGDPLADLGLTLCYWTWAPRAAEQITGIASVTSEPGWYTRDQFIERYARQTGRDTGNIRYYEVLGIFKLAVILQQIYYRYHRGQTRDPRFRNFGDQVVKLIGMAALLAE